MDAATRSRANAHHEAAKAHLHQKFPSFIVAVMNLGQIEWTESLPTAAVAARIANGKAQDLFRFLGNPTFALSLSVEKWAGVVAHETMHIVCHHLRMAARVNDKKRFNVAADCMINDYLISQGAQLPDNLCHGKELVGYDCTHRSVRDIYKALESSDLGSSSGQFDSHDMWEGLSDEDAAALDEAIAQAVKGAIARGEAVPREVKQRAGGGSQPMSGRKASTRGLASERKFAKTSGTGLAWARILRHIDPAIIRDLRGREPERPRTFYRTSYAFMGQPQNPAGQVRLPVPYKPNEETKKGTEKHQIVLALDTSGSITDEQQSMFMSLAQSLPLDLVDVYAMEFNDHSRRIDLADPKLTSGGTDFSAIERGLQRALADGDLKSYPKAVVIITDGDAQFNSDRPREHEARAWHWLIDGPISSSRKSFEAENAGTAHRLEKFVVRNAA